VFGLQYLARSAFSVHHMREASWEVALTWVQVAYIALLTPLQNGDLSTTEITEIAETKDNFIFH